MTPSKSLRERLAGLLRAAKCPNCDGSGGIAVQIRGRQYVTREMAMDAGDPSMEGSIYSDDEHEQQPCQWCEERDALLKRSAAVPQEPVAWSNDEVERIAKLCGWDNRRYMTSSDYQIWCDRMRKFAGFAAPQPDNAATPAPVAGEDADRVAADILRGGHDPRFVSAEIKELASAYERLRMSHDELERHIERSQGCANAALPPPPKESA